MTRTGESDVESLVSDFETKTAEVSEDEDF